MKWIDINEEQPKPQQRCYVICENVYKELSNGIYKEKITTFQTMAEFIPFKTVLCSDYMDENYCEGDYDEEKDDYFTPQGWYEWNSETDMNWHLSSKVTHWHPLFEKP